MACSRSTGGLILRDARWYSLGIHRYLPPAGRGKNIPLGVALGAAAPLPTDSTFDFGKGCQSCLAGFFVVNDRRRIVLAQTDPMIR